ncbi:hypothetical protein PoB_006311300 [Plakobranchus ocellatus]|uniref:Uncharacterized protein n=1 Tax=Plakobranchus ocellatus TaxID=259542 RepID=A0AAV4CXN4_9GAST|nr:hypothetical protein PoB_006311300 [Plakobranchus ocellatus]
MSGFEALHQARALVVGLEPGTGGSLQISGRIHYPLCRRRPKAVREQRPDWIHSDDDFRNWGSSPLYGTGKAYVPSLNSPKILDPKADAIMPPKLTSL